MRALTVINLLLWGFLFATWVPYTLIVGRADPVSAQVRWILVLTAGMQMGLFALRNARHRPVLG